MNSYRKQFAECQPMEKIQKRIGSKTITYAKCPETGGVCTYKECPKIKPEYKEPV